MLSFISGKLVAIESDRVVVETAGIGYELICSDNTMRRFCVDQQVKFYVHLQVSQDAVTLFGFHDTSEKEMFRKLINVSKIGPKTAINVLSVLTPTDIATAIITNNTAAFDKVSGIGKKTAQRLLLELKESVSEFKGRLAGSEGVAQTISENEAMLRSEAIAALVALGYDGLSAGRAVSAVKGSEFTIEELITSALKSMPD